MERPVTDFPRPGDTRRVSLRTSNHKPFDLRFALELQKQHPELWALGAVAAEPDEFAVLMPIQRRGGSIRSEREELAVRRREAWADRHRGDDQLPQVIAQIRWLVIGDLGIDAVKALVNAEKAKQPA